MRIVDWAILGIVIIAIAAALGYVRRHRNQCFGCGGDCGKCGEKRGQN